jgi:actin-related protein
MLRRPVEKGFIVDAAVQALIIEHILERLSITDESNVDLLFTVPFGAPRAVAELLADLLFRRFHFFSVTFCSPSLLALIASAKHGPAVAPRRRIDAKATTSPPEGCGVAVDCGFSSTTVVPYIGYFPVYDAMVRVSVGGKILTNRLKEIISFGQLNVNEDAWMVSAIKEACCYVVQDPTEELRLCKKQRRRLHCEYALPTIPQLFPFGQRKDLIPSAVNLDPSQIQTVTLRHEMFCIPELLFTPIDVGINEVGVSGAITEALSRPGSLLNVAGFLGAALIQHVVVFGGSSQFEGFLSRLDAELIAGNCSQAPPKLVPVQPKVQVLGKPEEKSARHGPQELIPLYGALLMHSCDEYKRVRAALQSRCRVLRQGPRHDAVRDKSGFDAVVTEVAAALDNLM